MKDSETVSKLIIEKLISNVIYAEKSNIIADMLGLHCFEYILNTSLYPVITQSFICYDYDDSDRKEKEIVTFYDNQREGENTWHELTEPSVPVSDRCEPAMVKTRTGDGNKTKEIRELNTNSGLDSFKYSLKISKTVSELEDNKKKNEVVELPCYDIAKTEEDEDQFDK